MCALIDTLANKYSVPYAFENIDLLSAIVQGTVEGVLSSEILDPYFNGSKGPNFHGDENEEAFNNLITGIL